MTWRCTPQRANPWPVSRARSCGAYVAVVDAFGGAGLRSQAMRRPRCSRPCRTPSYLSGTPLMPRRVNHVTSLDGRNTYAPHEACIGDEAITLFACPLYEPHGCGLGAGARRKHERAVSQRPAGR